MADFPASRNLGLTLNGSIQPLGVTYKENFFLLNSPANANNIEILAGDNDVVIWILAPGDSLQFAEKTVNVTTAFPPDVPLKVRGTNGQTLLGFMS